MRAPSFGQPTRTSLPGHVVILTRPVAALNPALAAATLGVSAWRKLMYSLIWQSVMWRPGKLRFLIGVKNPLPIRRTATARKHGPLRGRVDHQIRELRRAMPSFRHASGDTLSSQLTRPSQPVCRAADEARLRGSRRRQARVCLRPRVGMRPLVLRPAGACERCWRSEERVLLGASMQQSGQWPIATRYMSPPLPP
jgi:hypothetical protein